MRTPAALLLCLLLSAGPALSAEPGPSPATAQPTTAQPGTSMSTDRALRLQPGEDIRPGHAAWPLGERLEHGWRVTVGSADHAGDPAAPGFRVDIAPGPGTKGAAPALSAPGPRACLGLASALPLDLYLTRALEVTLSASRPAAGIVVLTSSNTQDRLARDRFFGSFGIGTQPRTLRLPYGTMALLPGWEAQAARQGLRPGDHVLRPDSVEELCIGVEAQRLPPGQSVTLKIDSLRFVR